MPDNTNAAPDFTSKDRFEVGENETAVGTVIATDADTRDYITSYAISGGDDHALFSITRLGALTFDGNGAVATVQVIGGVVLIDPLSAGTDAHSAQGTLTLRQQPSGLDSLGSAATPLYGFTNVNLRAVGAYEVGDPDSEDPQAPGVLVLESSQTGTRRILLRFGADANRRDDMLFDGAYTVLEVREIAADGFAGNWRSGLRLSRLEGYFCARREF